MTRYAATTEVDAPRSRAEIERTLQRYGATRFAYGWGEGVSQLAFELEGIRIRLSVPIPDPSAREFTHSAGTDRRRSEAARAKAHEQATRQRWRAVALLVKAQLEAVAAGIVTVSEAFLAYTVLPNGRTVHEEAGPQIARAYRDGAVPPLLIGGPS